MIRYVLALAFPAVLLPLMAQGTEQHGHSGMNHEMHAAGADLQSAIPREAGQSAFAAIQEIVAILVADPETDWSKVDIPALQRHLIDMNNVTLYAQAETLPVEDGLRFRVTGEGSVGGSIRRMLTAHGRVMQGARGFTYEVEEIPDGAQLTVHASSPEGQTMLTGLGFIGLMTLGAHHQEHHLAIAAGHSPH
ncbi:hypothetical protein [Roseibium litorale]|uniref:Uncharacterized protein n=1 Tax=Roseibium litorale TaxID=2803841 RepID=A0ABR9CTA2_9HYPH|nr:hypothetical protein [Roseibium litorale]MBD8894082.1 hypothetical protein [Roseibium litorale]